VRTYVNTSQYVEPVGNNEPLVMGLFDEVFKTGSILKIVFVRFVSAAKIVDLF
jgi:hypothetical protein